MNDTLLRIVALIRKELLAMLKDKRTRASLFLPPIIQCLIFGYAASYDLNRVPYVVLDQDRSAASTAFLADIDGSGVFHRVATLQRASEIREQVDARKALVAIQIGQNFERQLSLGQTAPVQIITDGRNSNTAGTALSYISNISQNFSARWQADHGRKGPPVHLTMRAWFNPALETRWNMIPGLIGTLTILQTLLLTAMSVAREREYGTFEQLLVTPYRPTEIMIGKALPSLLVGISQATLILLVAQLWFQIPFAGSFFTLYVGLAAFLLASIGIGLMVSSLVASMQQAMLFSFLLLMPFILLSGLSTPIANMPQSLQMLTFANPLRYAIDFTRRVYLEGADLVGIWPDIWPLLLIGVITLPIASRMFRHSLR